MTHMPRLLPVIPLLAALALGACRGEPDGPVEQQQADARTPAWGLAASTTSSWSAG